ncbi:helix-turn-helix domain-containing protein (plasmid) [Clostridium perfringens]|uniref:helix-turn-helix domain-containing protein n=1 Tax=Clostridium perfringens TaxID=1502 RepID=UPI00290F4691|nr:helix-turn-helix transcriptional regulator [Bacteroides caccae]MDU3664208.1 helix-turn-helix transcriptional regulator [Clostridium perfringens]
MYDFKYLKAEREKKGLTIRDMANLIEMNESNYGKIERGVYVNIPLYILDKLKKILNLDLNKFICSK